MKMEKISNIWAPYVQIQELWKYDSQQDLGSKGILTTQEIHNLCRKTMKIEKLTHTVNMYGTSL